MVLKDIDELEVGDSVVIKSWTGTIYTEGSTYEITKIIGTRIYSTTNSGESWMSMREFRQFAKLVVEEEVELYGNKPNWY